MNRSLCLLPLLLLAGAAARGAELTREEEAFFESKVRPLLVERCYECHSERAQPPKGGLLLDRRAGVLRGGDSGPAAVAGDVEQSLLIQAVRHGDDVSPMPPDEQLSAAEVEVLEQWVRIGLPDPRGQPLPETADPSEHWAFQPPAMPTLPTVQQSDWPRGPLDQLLLAGLERRGLSPSPDASSETLAKRLAYDLTGLPPSPELIAQLQADPSERGYRRLVEQLLASPRFGERWARHWLDIARYADNKGYVFQEERAYEHAWRYRDWVVQAWNRDLPYDRFLVEQIAADRLAEGPLDKQSPLAPMGFLTLGRRFLNNSHDIIDDRIDVVTRGTLGLTVSCARCHDHKYDPIPTADYYSLYSVFVSSEEPSDGPPLALVDKPRPEDIQIFLRGNPGSRGERAPRGFPRVLSDGEPLRFQDGSGRLELARAIASPDNPLTARVMVNRVWGRLTGRHLVDTPSDFGVRTPRPAQADTLDYLAVQLVRDGWSLKSLVRRIVLSRGYRQSSAWRSEAAEADPENELLWRMNRRRLDFEALRDTLLSSAGELDGGRIGGPPQDILAEQSRRRTLYAKIDRQNLPALFRTFDFANPDTHTPERPRTTVPQQALFLMNSRFAMQLAERIEARTAGLGEEDRIERIFQSICGRPPQQQERQLCRQLLADSPVDGEILGPWAQLAQVLMMSNELYFVD